ncbi:MAG: energy-coupling factor ABC transporter permease [Alphaproteobacteria bacterium]|nr:energy-coupling factor ABC transporter permease [Alphaproteobacteria bacterium]
MHMADALLSPVVGGGLWLASGAAIAYGSRRMKASLDHRQVPLMGVVGALVFAVQMLNFTIPGTGSSGHFAGGLLLAILLGPHAAFLTMASVLTVQALFFADGGLLALGANIFNMGFLACYVVYPCIFKPLAKAGASNRGVIFFSALMALQLGAFGVVLETSLSGIADLPFAAFLLAMQPIHLAIGIGEGLITLAVLDLIIRVEPHLLYKPAEEPVAGFLAGKRALAVLAVLAVLAGGILSLFASSQPDGLEWSIAGLVGDKKELAQPKTALHLLSSSLQERTTILPDYAFAESADEKRSADQGLASSEAGTSLSGLVGGLIVLLISLLAGYLFKRRSVSRVAS